MEGGSAVEVVNSVSAGTAAEVAAPALEVADIVLEEPLT